VGLRQICIFTQNCFELKWVKSCFVGQTLTRKKGVCLIYFEVQLGLYIIPQSIKGLCMEQHHEKELREIMGSLTCSKDFTCYNSGFKNLCQAEDIGLKSFIQCLEEHPTQCEFSIDFYGSYFCKCNVRIYVAKELKQ
jgi:hypothetical protein